MIVFENVSYTNISLHQLFVELLHADRTEPNTIAPTPQVAGAKKSEH